MPDDKNVNINGLPDNLGGLRETTICINGKWYTQYTYTNKYGRVEYSYMTENIFGPLG